MPPAQRPVLIGLIAGATVVVLDFFIVLACLPSIEHALDASSAQMQLIMAAYAIANGTFLVLGGRLGDLLGRKRVFMWGLGSFALASAACGLATSPVMLILFRVLQGISGALLQPQVLGLLTVNFEGPRQRRAFGYYGAAMGLAGILAQVVAGTMLELLPAGAGWRACFLLSVPVCALAAHGARHAADGRRSAVKGVDFVGAGLLASTLGCLGAFLTTVREPNRPMPAWVLLAAALLTAALFAIWLARGRATGAERIIPPGILGANGFGFGLLKIVAFFSGVASLYFVLALELRVASGFRPIQVGLYFALIGVCFALASSSVRLRALVGERWATAGLSILLTGHTLMAWASVGASGSTKALIFGVSCAAQGIGIGLILAPLMERTISRAPRNEVSMGSGMAASAQQMGNSLGICLIGLAYFGSGPSSPAATLFHGMPVAVVHLDITLLCLASLFGIGSHRLQPVARS